MRPAVSCIVGIDQGRPKLVRGLFSHGRRKGSTAFVFRINDPRPSCGWARVTRIVVTDMHGKRVATLSKFPKLVKTNAKVRSVVTCRLRKGTYRFSVYVTDVAGNKARKVTKGTVVIK